MKSKIISPQEAALKINNSDTLGVSGFVGIGFSEELAIALKERFLETGSPKSLKLIYAAGQGDGKEKGLNHFAHEGLIHCVIGGHWGLAPKLQKLAFDNKIEAYNLPQGVIAHLLRTQASGKPRLITKVGLGTFVDPKIDGGKINKCTTEEIVEDIIIDGERYLSYKPHPINVAFIRGTTADERGNVTVEKEALKLESQAMAIACKNSGGTVIVQVERIAQSGSLNPKHVHLPGIIVDYIVVAKPENHMQTFGENYNPSFAGDIKIPLASIPPLPMNERKIIARRAAMELMDNAVVNLGIGMPEGVSAVAAEEGIMEHMTLTAEPGVIGGMPAGGLDFGASYNAEAIINQDVQFDFYDGGGLDITFLGLAQTDKEGNLNVSKFGPKLAGAGGFINISQNTPIVIFIGTFTASGLKVRIDDDKLHIDQEGKVQKFIDHVEHITFSGKQAMKNGQKILYVTERAVFKLTDEGLELKEVAPGIDIERDILAHMEFKPIINEPKLMDARIFGDELMGLKEKFQ